MTRIIVASLVSAVVYFVWEMMTWMMIPIHGPTVAALPNEDAVRDALISQNLKSGVYIVPWGNEEDMTNPESQFMVRHKEGPLFTVFYHKDGEVPMAPSMMLGGFLLDILGALVAVGMLSFVSDAKRLATYGARVGFVTALGVFLSLMAHVAYYNWMHFAAYFTAMFVVDALVGWFLVGLIAAAIIRPPVSDSAPGELT